MSLAWTTPADLREQVRRYWDSGRLLAAPLQGESLFPLELRLRGPENRALSERFEEVRQWIRELESESRYRIEWVEINHRLLGRNRVPARILVPEERDALGLIGKIEDAERFRSLHRVTLERHPELAAWLAGGGVKGGTIVGATDEIGYAAAENKVHVHDLHATILHLLGLDHTLLTYFHGGREQRLTDVAGRVVKEALA